jgi:hypothetical protein
MRPFSPPEYRTLPPLAPIPPRRIQEPSYLIEKLLYRACPPTIAPGTVKPHVKHIPTKLGIEQRGQAVARAQRPWACDNVVSLGAQRREAIQRAHDLADRLGGDAGIEGGGLELGVTEQHLDHADIDALLQEMGCKTVAQRVRRHPFGDLGHVSGGMNGAVELARGEMVDRVLSGKQLDLGPCDPPPVTQQFQQLWGEHRKAILAPLALLDPQQHALGVDIRHLQRDDLGNAQARPIGH